MGLDSRSDYRSPTSVAETARSGWGLDVMSVELRERRRKMRLDLALEMDGFMS